MTGKKKYSPISKLPRLLKRNITAVVDKKPTRLELMKEEFHRKMLKEKERKIIELYEQKQSKMIVRVAPRVLPPIDNKPTGVNTTKPSSRINTQEPIRQFLREGEGKSMAEIQAHYRRPFKINAPRRSTVPNRSHYLPPIERKNIDQEQKNVQSKGRQMSASRGSSSPKDLFMEVRSESQSDMAGEKDQKQSFNDNERRKSLDSNTDSNSNDVERQIVGVPVDELEGLQDFHKWKIEQLRVKEERLYKKALKAKRMGGESADDLKDVFEERLLLKQHEVLDELAERQREQHRLEEQRLEKARQETEELERKTVIEKERQEKIEREREASARRKERKKEKRTREERKRRARAQQEDEEPQQEEEPQLHRFISYSPPQEGFDPKTREISNSGFKESIKGGILPKQNELLAELAKRQRELEIMQEQRLEKERQEADNSGERTTRTVATPEKRNSITPPENTSPRAMTPQTANSEGTNQIDVNVELYFQAAEESSQINSQTFNLKECRICGRRFAAERLQKHESCCRTANKKRKQFDPAKKRWQGTDALLYHRKADKTVAPPKRKKDYRKQHEEFRKTVQYAKRVQEVEKNGGDIRQITPPPPIENPDYVQCPHCERKFNSAAAERHIPRCVDIKGRPLRKR